MKEEILIIGGGLGGLMTGALLAKEGFVVTVLEKNGTVGGGLQTFHRHGIAFETGMHILGGFRPGGSLRRICTYLGVMDRLQLRPVDADCMDQITYASDGATYRIAAGREGFVESLAAYFPTEKENLRRYVDRMYALTQELDLFYLRSSEESFHPYSDEFTMPADRFIARYIAHPKLRDILAYMNPMYGGIAGHTPAYVHALINVLYINGTDRFVGGSQQLATARCRVIESEGGQVVPLAQAERIETTDRMVSCVHTKDGRKFSARYYISAVHPDEMLRIADTSAFPKAYASRLRSIPSTYSTFSLFVELHPKAFPYINHTCYYQQDYDKIWNLAHYDEQTFPYGFMYMTPPTPQQTPWASHLIVNCLMPFEAVSPWEDSHTGRRDDSYRAWKKRQEERIIDRMEELHPHFRQAVKQVWSGSPLTIRDYYHTTRGAIYGYSKDCNNLLLSQVPVVTKVRNLFLTGQCVGLHGICGVPLSAITTAEAIVGRNVIIRKL